MFSKFINLSTCIFPIYSKSYTTFNQSVTKGTNQSYQFKMEYQTFLIDKELNIMVWKRRIEEVVGYLFTKAVRWNYKTKYTNCYTYCMTHVANTMKITLVARLILGRQKVQHTNWTQSNGKQRSDKFQRRIFLGNWVTVQTTPKFYLSLLILPLWNYNEGWLLNLLRKLNSW